MARNSRYIIGIDLGTTNTAIAYVERRRQQDAVVTPYLVTQRVSETQVAARRTMPSFLYLPGEHELPQSALSLPWTDDLTTVVGEFARAQGARVPTRLVKSAKSWLCHARADRTGPILPWDAPSDVQRVSPVEASARYLAHIRDAWDHQFGRQARFREQEIVLCVPASFNEVARELTVQAAGLAGLDDVTLLEEPQAAFYAWLDRHRDGWLSALESARSILVCDIGGGTTDFTMIDVTQGDGAPALRRVAVGEHLMLGGDNMDLALAHVVEQALGASYDSRTWGILVHECRGAKERLLAPDAPEEHTIAIAGRGSRLVGGLTTVPLPRDDVHQIILDGFFPVSEYDVEPTSARRSALSEWGLPYASDPAVSHHLSAFLRHQGNIADPAKIPDVVLFNGAALEPDILRQRVLDVMGHWSGHRPRALPNHDLDLAVARGAAYFGWVRENGGLRISGGMARAYYVGVAGGPPPQAACLIPRGLEEGQGVEIREPEFKVVVDRPVSFPLYASSVRHGDGPGDLVALDAEDFQGLPPLATVLHTRRKSVAAPVDGEPLTKGEPAPSEAEAPPSASEPLPPEPEEMSVHLQARVTEIGTLELWCVARESSRRWRLQFQVRGAGDSVVGGDPVASAPTEDPMAVRRASQRIVDTFLVKPGRLDSSELKPRGLMWALEEIMHEKRDAWSLGFLRDVWEALDRVKHRRRSSAAYEGPWLNACGFSLRPGFGFPLDDWRVNRTWALFESGLQFPKAVHGRLEWWVMWRRIAGGLERERQRVVFDELAPHLLPRLKHVKTRLGPPVSSAEWTEVLRLAASLERLDASLKERLGHQAVERLEKRPATLEYWMLARLGARISFASSPHHCVPPDVVESWMRFLLEQPWKDPRMAGFALTQMGRLTGDRARDLPESVRRAAVQRLREEHLESFGAPLLELVELADEEKATFAGESLPVGLRIA